MIELGFIEAGTSIVIAVVIAVGLVSGERSCGR